MNKQKFLNLSLISFCIGLFLCSFSSLQAADVKTLQTEITNLRISITKTKDTTKKKKDMETLQKKVKELKEKALELEAITGNKGIALLVDQFCGGTSNDIFSSNKLIIQQAPNLEKEVEKIISTAKSDNQAIVDFTKTLDTKPETIDETKIKDLDLDNIEKRFNSLCTNVKDKGKDALNYCELLKKTKENLKQVTLNKLEKIPFDSLKLIISSTKDHDNNLEKKFKEVEKKVNDAEKTGLVIKGLSLEAIEEEAKKKGGANVKNDDLNTANDFVYFADKYINDNDLGFALNFFNKALDLFKKYDSDHDVKLKITETEKKIKETEKLMKDQEAKKRDLDAAQIFIDEYFAAMIIGEYKDALTFAKEALKIYQKYPDKKTEADGTNEKIDDTTKMMGAKDKEEAKKTYLKLASDIYSDGETHLSNKNYKEALDQFNKALDMYGIPTYKDDKDVKIKITMTTNKINETKKLIQEEEDKKKKQENINDKIYILENYEVELETNYSDALKKSVDGLAKELADLGADKKYVDDAKKLSTKIDNYLKNMDEAQKKKSELEATLKPYRDLIFKCEILINENITPMDYEELAGFNIEILDYLKNSTKGKDLKKVYLDPSFKDLQATIQDLQKDLTSKFDELRNRREEVVGSALELIKENLDDLEKDYLVTKNIDDLTEQELNSITKLVLDFSNNKIAPYEKIIINMADAEEKGSNTYIEIEAVKHRIDALFDLMEKRQEEIADRIVIIKTPGSGGKTEEEKKQEALLSADDLMKDAVNEEGSVDGDLDKALKLAQDALKIYTNNQAEISKINYAKNIIDSIESAIQSANDNKGKEGEGPGAAPVFDTNFFGKKSENKKMSEQDKDVLRLIKLKSQTTYSPHDYLECKKMLDIFKDNKEKEEVVNILMKKMKQLLIGNSVDLLNSFKKGSLSDDIDTYKKCTDALLMLKTIDETSRIENVDIIQKDLDNIVKNETTHAANIFDELSKKISYEQMDAASCKTALKIFTQINDVDKIKKANDLLNTIQKDLSSKKPATKKPASKLTLEEEIELRNKKLKEEETKKSKEEEEAKKSGETLTVEQKEDLKKAEDSALSLELNGKIKKDVNVMLSKLKRQYLDSSNNKNLNDTYESNASEVLDALINKIDQKRQNNETIDIDTMVNEAAKTIILRIRVIQPLTDEALLTKAQQVLGDVKNNSNYINYKNARLIDLNQKQKDQLNGYKEQIELNEETVKTLKENILKEKNKRNKQIQDDTPKERVVLADAMKTIINKLDNEIEKLKTEKALTKEETEKVCETTRKDQLNKWQKEKKEGEEKKKVEDKNKIEEEQKKKITNKVQLETEEKRVEELTKKAKNETFDKQVMTKSDIEDCNKRIDAIKKLNKPDEQYDQSVIDKMIKETEKEGEKEEDIDEWDN